MWPLWDHQQPHVEQRCLRQEVPLHMRDSRGGICALLTLWCIDKYKCFYSNHTYGKS